MKKPDGKSADLIVEHIDKLEGLSVNMDVLKQLVDLVHFEHRDNVLDTVKPTSLIRRMLQLATEPEAGDIVLDFAAGSGPADHAIGGGVQMVCLAEQISTEETEALSQGLVGWHKALPPAGDTTCVFHDSAFENDVAKTNLAAILEQAGIANVRSL